MEENELLELQLSLDDRILVHQNLKPKRINKNKKRQLYKLIFLMTYCRSPMPRIGF